jgi:hypothetical protein
MAAVSAALFQRRSARLSNGFRNVNGEAGCRFSCQIASAFESTSVASRLAIV